MSGKMQYYPLRTNQHLLNMNYASDVGADGFCRVDIPAPVAANAAGILSAQSIATAGSIANFAAAYSDAAMAKFGRNVQVVASGAATSTVSVYGLDYLGQPMMETLTLNGATPVQGKKAFKRITNIVYGATAATTINVGWGNVLGLPYRTFARIAETVDGVVPTAGVVTAGTDIVQTATSADPRGTYTPDTSVAPNGSRKYAITVTCDNVNNLYGAVHFAG